MNNELAMNSLFRISKSLFNFDLKEDSSEVYYEKNKIEDLQSYNELSRDYHRIKIIESLYFICYCLQIKLTEKERNEFIKNQNLIIDEELY